MTTTFAVPAENPLTGETTTVNLTIENNVLAALEASKGEDGMVNEDAFCIRLTGFTKKQLTDAFEKVQDKDHWKNPISAVIPNTELLLTMSAIEHFHGPSNTKTEIVEVRADGVVMIRVTNAGYSC
jgi:hypothetical protein